MCSNNLIGNILKNTPTSYVLYEISRDSSGKQNDYKVLDYNPSFLNLIGEDKNPVELSNIQNFLANINGEFVELEQAFTSTNTPKATYYSSLYEKWFKINLFSEDNKAILQIVDLTKEKQLEDNLMDKSIELDIVTNVISDFILVVDLDAKISHANKSLQQILGYGPLEFLGKNIKEFISESSYNEIITTFEDNTIFKPNHIIRTTLKNREDKRIVVEWKNTLYNGKVYSIGRDVTELIETQQRILYLSYHDKLTGLYNRAFFEEELNRLDDIRNLPLSIIMGDVNGLKIINDVFGHLEGDNLLKTISKILKDSLRKGDILSRWGGDEFIILLPNTNEISAKEIIGRIYQNCKNESDKLNFASISLGYETKKYQNENIYTILTSAENNMYKNKSKEGKTFRSSLMSSMVDHLYEREYEKSTNANRMKSYLDKLSDSLNLTPEDKDKLFLLTDFHDIGMIAVPENILNKAGPLLPSDWEEIKKHPETGFRIAKSIPEMTQIANNILYHHERYDGKGYPHKLKGREIPYLNRIFSIIDVYDSLSQNKIYRSSFTEEEILYYFIVNKGSIFDPILVDKFLNILF